MSIALVYASGKYTAATCPTPTVVLLRSLMPSFIRFLSFSAIFLSPMSKLIRRSNETSLLFGVSWSESETRDSKMLPAFGGNDHEEMLGPESRQASGDGGGGEAA